MRVLDLAKAFLSALGLTGSLIVAGYIIESAYQQLLGTEGRYLGTTAYLGSASEFLLDLSLLFTRVGKVKAGLLTVLVVGVLLMGRLIRRRQNRIRKLIRPWRRRLLLLVAAGALLNFLYYVLPTIKLENILTGDLDRLSESDPNRPWTQFGFVSGDRQLLSTICGHMPVPSTEASEEYKEMEMTCTKFTPANYKSEYQEYYRAQSELELAQNVLNVLSLTALAIIIAIAAGHLTLRLMDWEMLLTGLLLAVNLLGLPYQYGKSLRLKPVRFAAIFLEPDLKPVKNLGEYKTGLILYEDDTGFTFVEAQARKIWFIARSKVVALQVISIEDILAYYLAESIAKVKESE